MPRSLGTRASKLGLNGFFPSIDFATRFFGPLFSLPDSPLAKPPVHTPFAPSQTPLATSLSRPPRDPLATPSSYPPPSPTKPILPHSPPIKMGLDDSDAPSMKFQIFKYILYVLLALCAVLALSLGLGLGLNHLPPAAVHYANGQTIGISQASLASVSEASVASAKAATKVSARALATALVGRKEMLGGAIAGRA